jgi:peroxiredoxin
VVAVAATATLAAVLVGTGCGPQDARTPRVTGQPAQVKTRDATSEFAEGEPLPPWELPDLSGQLQPVYLRSANVTVINFWATWCVPCLREIPELVALNDGWQARGVRLVGVAIASGSAGDVQAFATMHGMRYPLLTATEDPARRYFGRLNLMLALPVTLLLDHAGVIRRRLIGPQTRGAFEAAVREAS